MFSSGLPPSLLYRRSSPALSERSKVIFSCPTSSPADEGLIFAALEDLALLARSLGSSDSAFSDEYLRHVNIELGLEILILADRFAGRLHDYRKAAL